MNFNDLTVKITSNANYQSLQPNKQEQIKALIKGYESYAQNITQSFYDNIAKMQKETQDKIKNAKTWGTVLNFASLGTYPTVKGIVNGLTDFATGVINIRTQLVNNIGQVYAQDGRFGGGIDGFFKELGSDLLYTVADPLISVVEGLAKGGGSITNILGWNDAEFNRYLDLTTKIGVYERDQILTLGEKEDDSFSRMSWFLNDTSNPDKDKLIKEHTWDWARDYSKAVAQGGTWFKDNVSPVIGKMISPVGIAIDDLGQNEAGEFFSGTMESVGRMIPAIVAAYFGDATALASAASQIYFFSSSFGNGFSEAIARGATMEEAYTYGYGMATIETLTEQIGGVQIGKLLPGGVATKVATSKFGKALQHPVMRVIKAGIDEGFEEVMSEAMSVGLESIISDDPVSNQDFMSRAMSAFLGGAISGGIFGGAGYYTHQKSTVGKVNSLNKEIKRIYEGQNKDYGKAQQAFNQKVDGLLNSYNRDSIVDNNLIEEGKRTPESRIQAKKDLLENSGFASILIEYNEKNQNFQLTKKGIEMTTDLESYMGDSNKNAYSSTLYGLEDTLAAKVTNQELTSEQQDVMKLSKKLGSDVVFFTDSDTSINGFFKDGVVYINTESKKSDLGNFIHELTHSLEGTKQYDTLKNFIMEISETNEILKAKMEELGLTKENIIKDYWNQISNLKNIESKAYLMASEYVAFAMSEVILKDKASIESLTKNKTIGRKILNWIKEKIADIKTPKTDIEKAFLKDLKHAKDLYEEALGVGYRKGLKIGEVDKRFSLKIGDNEIVVDTESINDDLVALHNISENNLIKTIELGGFAMPSIAVTKPNMSHEGYGDITVIFGKDTIDPKKTTKNKVWSGDKWTSTFPQVEYEIDTEFIRKLGEKTGLEVFGHQGYQVERMLKNYGLEGTVESIASNPDTKEYFEKNPPKAGLTVEEYLTEVIGNAILNTGIRNNVDIFTNAGNRRSFSQTHYKVSLENILKSMIKSETEKGVFYGGTGSMAASNMKNYRSINEIKKDIWKIVDENTTNAQKIELENQLLDVIGDILDNKKYVDKNRFIALDNAETILRELGGDGVNKTNIEKWYKEYEINGSEELTNKIIQMFENLRNKYVRYFESKPERIVNLSEIKNVLLPEKTQQKLINLLNENNIPYEVYGEEGRKTHVENMKDIRFSKTIDSEGRKLTVEQEKYFKDSKVVDKDGNLLVVYHGSEADFNVFDKNKTGSNFWQGEGGFFFSSLEDTAEHYGETRAMYLNIVNPYIITANSDTAFDAMRTYDMNAATYKGVWLDGYDGIMVIDNGKHGYGNMYVAFEPNQIKNINNLNPTSSEDIRYSKTIDSEGRKLTVEQEKYFKDSKFRDAKGRLQVVYHGTNSKFNEFVFSKIDKSNPKLKGFWFINNKQNAYQYGSNIKEGYVNITKPLSLEDKHINKEQYTNFLEYVFNNDGENKTLIQQKDFKENISELYDSIENDYELINYIQSMYNEDSKISRFNEILKEKTGYDGTIFEDGGNTIAISLSPNQFKAVDNLTPTSNVDVRYSRDLNKGVKTKTEIPFVEKFINESYNNFNKKQIFIDNNLRTKDFNNVFSKKKEISKRKNGKKIVAILEKFEKDYAYIIRKQDIRGELYNYLFNNVLEQITIELDSNFNENVFNNKEQVVNNIERVISNTMAYLDNTFNNNELNISNSNPQGFQYTRGFNWAMREFNVKNKDMELIKKGVGNIVNLIDAVINLDLTDNKSIDMFMAGIGSFRKATHVEQRNSLAIETSGNRVQTLPNVLRQNSVHIDALTKINGNYTKGFDGKNVYNKGLLGYDFMKGLNNPLLDMYAFGNIFGMGMEKSLGNVITKQLEKATIKQLTVTNRFNEFFEKDGFIKKNTDNLNKIEREVVEVSNLIDKNGEKIFIPKSQIITLRNIMLREIIRNRLIENGFRGGELSNKFNKDMLVYFNGNSDNNLKNKKDRRSFKIKNTFDLFNELDDIVNKDSFMKKYNKKLLSFFETMYEYENNANKDLRGRELTNDKVFIENLSEQERNALKQGLNDNVDISLIYVPMTSLNESGQSGGGAFDINRVIDLGIDDGMVMGIQENENPSLIDSVNSVISKFAKSVANFYGLYRVTEDLNLLFNKEIYINSKQKITLKAKVDNLNPNIIKFYETLLRNMSGYQIEKDSLYGKLNKTLGVVKRNYYKATLGSNFKVIATQFASLFTTGTMYGDFKGTKKSLTLGMWKNVFVKGSKTKAKYLIENSEIYKDRARNSINEVSEARSSKLNRSRFNRFTEFSMKGINLTDSMINRALFITLVEHGYSEQQALKMTEQAILRYQSSGLAIGKNSLLRTEHEVVKLFTKFLSEPMKVVSNVTESANILKVIKNLESNKTNIVSHFENELSNLIKENDKLKNDLSKLDEKVDKELIKELKTEIKFNDDKILDLERYNKTIENQINNVIESKGEAIKVFAKRLTGAMLSLLWQTSLGVIFSQMRFGNDDKDEDEETWVYLSKKFGWQFASEFIGYIPIGRDIYSMIIDGFDINVIDELNVYNDFLSNVSGLYKDIANGGDFDWGKHLRKSAITIGQLTGIPTKNIERFFTTPSKMFSKSTNYIYRDMTGQYIGSNELNNAIKNGDEKLIETIINRKMNGKNLSLTFSTTKEINRLAKNGVVVNPSGIPNSFSIDGIEYKNDKDKFAETYNNATFVIEKIITLNGYKRLNDEYKAKLVKAIFTYYHSLAKQNVSGVQIFTKERTYNLNQAYRYFRDRISYYMNQQQKEKKRKEKN